MHPRSSPSSLDGHMNTSADADPLIKSQDEAMSAQHDLDSIIAHVTETQYTQGDNLEMDSLSELANDVYHQPHMNPTTNSEPIVHELKAPVTDPSSSTNSQSVHLFKHVARPEVREVEHCGKFAFAQALKSTPNYSRRIGQSQPQASHLNSAVVEKAMSAGSELVPDKEQTESKALTLSQNKAAERTNVQKHEFIQHGLQRQQASGHMPLPNQIVQETIITRARPPSQRMETESSQSRPQAIIDLTAEPSSMQHLPSDGHGQSHVAPSNGKHEILRVWKVSSNAHPGELTNLHTSNESRQCHSEQNLQQPPAQGLQSHPAIRTAPTNSTEPPEIPWTPSRVTKTWKKPKVPRTLQNLAAQTQPDMLGSEPGPEDLLTILLFRARQDKKARALAKAIQQAKEAELENMNHAYTLLKAQMQELSQREQAQQAELVKYQKALPGWKTKLRRLDEYVKGLTNDHNKLRDDASIIQDQQQNLKTGRDEIAASIKEARETFGRTSANTTKILIGAKQRINKLERRVEEQNTRHEENMNRLDAERAHKNKLEQDVSRIAASQQQIEGLLRTERQAMIEKLDELFSKPLATESTESVPSDFQKHTWDMLDRVLGLLTEIKAIDKANPEHLLRIDETITDFAGQLGNSLQQLIGASKSSKSIQLKLKRNLHRQMEDLRVHLIKEESLAEQVTDLRESKAAITESLQGNETALAEARQLMASLQAREKLLGDEVVGLKAEVQSLQARPTEDQAIKSHLHQSEVRSSELEAEVARLLSSLSVHAGQLEQSNEKAKRLQDYACSLEAQLDEGRTRASKLEEEKAACELQARAKYESLRRQLFNAANAEREMFFSEQSTALQQLERKKAYSDGRAKQLEEEVKELKVARAREVESSIQLHSNMEVLHAQLQENDQQLVATRETLRLREEDLQSKCAENQVLKANDLNHARQLVDVEARLALVTAESRSKDEAKIRKIKEAGQSLNQNMKDFSSFEDALDALLKMLVESAKPEPATVVLREMGSQELPLGQASLSQSSRTHPADHESQELPYGRRHSVSTPKEVSNEIDTPCHLSSQGDQAELAIEELEIEETTYHRNVTMTRLTCGIDGASMFSDTPSRVSNASFSRTDGRPYRIGSESPMLDTTGLFPPTPIPSSKSGEARIDVSTPGRAQIRSRNGMNPMRTNGEGSAAQSTQSMPRSILKPSRPGKRRLSGSFLWSPVQASPKRRASPVERQGLGPIIPDSQNTSQGGETKANTKARKSTRRGTDKFTRRFNNGE